MPEEVRFTCPGCGKTFKMSNPALRGKRIKCPSCAGPITIPAEEQDEGIAPAERRAAVSRARPAPRVEEEDEERPVRSRKAAAPPEEDEEDSEDRPRRRRRSEEEEEEDREDRSRGRRRSEEEEEEEAEPPRSGKKWWLDPISIGAGVVALIYLVYLVGAHAGPFRAQPIDIPVPSGPGAGGKTPFGPGAGGKQAPDNWVEMTTKRGGLPFQMPQKSEPIHTPLFQPGAEESVAYSGFNATTNFSVEELTFSAPLTPEQTEKELRDLATRSEVEFQRKVTGDRRITLKGHPGREMESVSNSTKTRAKLRRYVIGRHVVTLIWSERGVGPAPDAEADRFFNSFQPR
jgi:hypothetical protein